MKNARNWTKTMGAVALGVMVMAPVASYAVDMDLEPTQRQARFETRAGEQERNGSSERYMKQERKMEKKTSEERAQKRSQMRERTATMEHEYGTGNHERQGSGTGSYGGGDKHRKL